MLRGIHLPEPTMANEATLSPALSREPGTRRPLWPALTAWWSRAEAPADPELGYESAHPWALGVDTPADADDPIY